MLAAMHRILLPGLAVLLALPPTASAGDLTVDLVFSNFSGAAQLCLRDGRAKYACGDLAADTDDARAVAVGDVNGDGALDVVLGFGPDRLNRLCRGDGAGSFTCADIGSIPATTGAIALADLNGDGKLDAIFGTGANQLNQVCLGNGSGGFTCGEIGDEPGDTRAIAVGDVNGDGKPDIVFARAGAPSQVCLGDGSGAFSCAPISPRPDDTLGVALGDVNHDGKLDVVLANVERLPNENSQHNRVCLGNGMGTFDCHEIDAVSHRSVAVALGDLDRDGNLDAVFASTNQGSALACFGDGHGDFDCRPVDAARATSSNGVAVVDLDGNGTLDIVFASAIVHRGEPNRACLGGGNGSFDCRNVTDDLFDSSGVATGTFTPAR